jgi:hypothetical protein
MNAERQEDGLPATDAATDGGCVEHEQWPDTLIRAVALEAPELFRSGDPYACRGQDLIGYASQLALVSLEEEDLGVVDLAAYAAEVSEHSFRRFSVEGETWFVADWQSLKCEPEIELPTSYESLSVEKWSDALIGAVGQQSPALLRSARGEAWAIEESEFPCFASFWLFEGYCDPMLYRHVDLKRYTEERRGEFTAVTAAGERWQVHAGEDGSFIPAASADGRAGLRLVEWSDQLVTSVAASLPQVFRTHDYEMICAVPDEQLAQVLAEWAEGLEGDVERAGGLAAWSERVQDEDFRSLKVGSQRWWVHVCDWERLAPLSCRPTRTPDR